jgi:hypothetical protein
MFAEFCAERLEQFFAVDQDRLNAAREAMRAYDDQLESWWQDVQRRAQQVESAKALHEQRLQDAMAAILEIDWDNYEWLPDIGPALEERVRYDQLQMDRAFRLL